MKNACTLVLGGHVNGYSIVRELSECTNSDIIVFDYGKSLARYSNKVAQVYSIARSSESLLFKINNLKKQYSTIVIYPTDDMQLEWLYEISSHISDFSYLPFNKSNLLKSLNKFFQYEICKQIGVPFPQSNNLKERADLSLIENMVFPILVKPSTRKDLELEVFRTLTLDSLDDYSCHKEELTNFIDAGIEFVASELIPGDDTNIYAYTCFRSNEGEILNEWAGKKLTQYPDEFGIFCSASNEAPTVVSELGRRLVEALDCYGIVEPEFKYDVRDGLYKLMEVNLRSMMWHRVGNLSGVKLQACQYNYALGRKIEKYTQDSKKVHYVLMLHEIPNIISRKSYFKHFKYNVFSSKNRVWAIFDPTDMKPFLASLILLGKGVVKACQKRFFQK